MDDLFWPSLTWRDRAGCLDQPVDWFFPMPGPNLKNEISRAKAICSTCPVKQQCLDYAMSFVRGRYITLPGIYGGTTETERWKLARTHVINNR